MVHLLLFIMFCIFHWILVLQVKNEIKTEDDYSLDNVSLIADEERFH